jgi:hypothetical protein
LQFNIPEVENGYPVPKNASTPKKDIYNPKDNRDIYFHALNVSLLQVKGGNKYLQVVSLVQSICATVAAYSDLHMFDCF